MLNFAFLQIGALNYPAGFLSLRPVFSPALCTVLSVFHIDKEMSSDKHVILGAGRLALCSFALFAVECAE